MYFDGRAKMFMKKMEYILLKRKGFEFLYKLDIIRNLSTNIEYDDRRFAYDERLKMQMYKNKLMPNAENNYRFSRVNNLMNFITTNQPGSPTSPHHNHTNLSSRVGGPILNTTNVTKGSNFPGKSRRGSYMSLNLAGIGNEVIKKEATKTQSNILSIQGGQTKNTILSKINKDNKYYKLSTINSQFNNFIQESEVPFFPEKNSLGSFRGKGTFLSGEPGNKREMFRPRNANSIFQGSNLNFSDSPPIISIIGSSQHNSGRSKKPSTPKLSKYSATNTNAGGNTGQNQPNSVVSGNSTITNQNVNAKSPHPIRDRQPDGGAFGGQNIAGVKNIEAVRQHLSVKYSNLIRIGDICLIRYNYKSEETGITNEGILYPEQITSKQIFCIPMNKIEDLGGGKSIFKKTLFRIENPQSCLFQYQYENAKRNAEANRAKEDKTEESKEEYKKELENLNDLKYLAAEEKKGNESEFQLNYNNEVAYGQMIQFRNVFTNELLVVDLANISREIGCLNVVLSPLGGQTAWFKIIPCQKIRNQGECVSYLDYFYIVPTNAQTESFVHVNHNDENNLRGMEVNISSRGSIFNLSLFDSALNVKKEQMRDFVKSTAVIKLYNQDYEGYLKANFKPGTNLLPKLKTEKNLQVQNYQNTSLGEGPNTLIGGDEKSSLLINFETQNAITNKEQAGNNQNTQEENEGTDSEVEYSNEGDDDYLSMKRSSAYVVYVDTKQKREEDCNSYWEIQYEKPYEGQMLVCGSPIRLRHVASGFYLAFNYDSNEVHLTHLFDDTAVFYIYSDNQDNNINESELLNSSQVYFFAKNTDSYLKVNTAKKTEGRYDMMISKEDKLEYAKMIFKIEVQKGSLVHTNYNASLSVHHLRNIFNDINSWGIRTILGGEIKKGYVYDYFLCVEGEDNFAEMIDLYKKILTYLLNESVRNKPESFKFKTFQNFHTDQGIITILLNFVLLLDSKSIKGKGPAKNNTNTPESIAVKYTPAVIDMTFQIIQYLLNDNYNSAKSIYSSLEVISKLFEFHKLEIIQILIMCLKNTNSVNRDNIFFLGGNTSFNGNDSFNGPLHSVNSSLISHNKSNIHNFYAQISFWKEKLDEINEKANNLHEQSLFIQIIQMLCLDSNGNGIFLNQMEVKIKLFENDIFPLKFGLDDSNHPYVIFNTKLSYDEFFSHNPSLADIRLEKKNFRDVPIFLYGNFTKEKFSAYIDYIVSVLDFYYASCVSRNEINIHIISNSKHVGLTIAHIWQVLNDTTINMSIRTRYLKLFRVLFIDTSPYKRISKFRLRVYMWNKKPKDKEDLIEYIYKWFNNSNADEVLGVTSTNEKDKFDFVKIYIRNFFKKINNVENIVGFDSYEDLVQNKEVFLSFLQYLKEVFILTNEMIDFGYFGLNDINDFLIGFAYFFSIFEKYNSSTGANTSEDNNISGGVVSDLIESKASKFIKSKASNQSTFRGSKYHSRILRNQHWLANLAFDCLESPYIEIRSQLFSLYESCIDILHIICTIKEDLQLYEFVSYFQTWYYEGNSLSDSMDFLRIYNHISNTINILDFEIEDKDSDDSFRDENDKNLIPLDIYLLGILFNDYDNEFSGNSLDNKALSLLIKYFNEYENLKKQLTTIEIIVNSADIEIFNNLFLVNTRIIDSKNLLCRDYVTFQITQNMERQGNIRRLQDLIRNIENELVLKLELKNVKKLTKVQNMCRHLKIHETLIELMNFLLAYDKKLPIYNSIFKFLYHFCYKNYHNQVSLKKYFVPFLNILTNYSYVCEVLTEILNLYKETPKSKKYIDMIFDKIVSDDEIGPEIIDVLRTLTINYKGENLQINQGIIIQNFLYHSKFLKLTFDEESKKQFDKMFKGIKAKDQNSKNLLKKLNARVKFVQLLTSCSLDNSFCVLNCRRLVKIENITKYIVSEEIPYSMKPAFLAFFRNVFYPSTGTTNMLYGMEHVYKIFKALVLPELKLFYFFSSYYIDNLTEKYANDPSGVPEAKKAQIKQLKEITLQKIREDPDIKQYLTIDVIDLKLLEVNACFGPKKFLTETKKKEYFKFLLSDNYNYNLKQEGLLIFLYDIFRYMTVNNIRVSLLQRTTLSKIKKALNSILDFMTIIEEKIGEDENITEIEYAIQRCLTAIPKTNYDKIIKKMAQGGNTIFKLPLQDLNEKEKKEDDNNSNNSNEKLFSKKEEDNAIKVLKLIQKYLIVNKTNVTGIFNLLDTDNDKQIDKFEFKRNLKLLLNSEVTNEEIEDTMNYIDSNQDDKISLKELSVKLFKISKEAQNKKKYNLNNYQDIKIFLDVESELDDKSYKIACVFRHFILAFHDIQEKIGKNYEIKELVNKLTNFLGNDNRSDFIKKFLDCLKNSFFEKKKNKIYLLRMMSELIAKQVCSFYTSNNLTTISSTNSISVIQNQLNDSGVTEFVMSLIDDVNSKEVIEESLNLIILLLNNANQNVQQTVYAYLLNPDNTFGFLSFTREIMHGVLTHLKRKINIKEYETIVETKNKNNSNFYTEMDKFFNRNINLDQLNIFDNFSSNQIEEKIFLVDEQQYFRIPYKVLLLFQLCCQNCFEPFQHFLRDQDYNRDKKDTINSINIVYEVANLSISLLNFGNVIYIDREAFKLVNQSFLTLASFCLGPCKENQILLGARKTMFKMLNNLLRSDYNFDLMEPTHHKKNILFCKAITFLKALVSGETIKDAGKYILDEIDIYLLVEKMIDIYVHKVKDNIKKLYRGGICNHNEKKKNIFKGVDDNLTQINIPGKADNKCTSLHCKDGFVSETDMKFINTAFNIFIILTYLREAFPDHKKLKWFKFEFNSKKVESFDQMASTTPNVKLHKTSTGIKRTRPANQKAEVTYVMEKTDSNENGGNVTIYSTAKKNNNVFLIDDDLHDGDSFSLTKLKNNINDNVKKCCSSCCKSVCCSCSKKKVKIKYSNIIYQSEPSAHIYKKKEKDRTENDIQRRFLAKYNSYFNETYMFFAQNISNVEICYRNEIVKAYFKIPFLFKFFRAEYKKNIIWDSQYENHQARLEELFKQVVHIKRDLIHQQHLGSYRIMFQKWSILNDISFSFSIIINLLLFFFIKNDDVENCFVEEGKKVCQFVELNPNFDYFYVYKELQTSINFLQYIQLAINFIVLLFYIVSQYPMINYALDKKASDLNLVLNEKKIEKYSGSLLFYLFYEFIDKISSKHKHFLIKIYKAKVISFFFDVKVLVFTLYLLVTICGILITPFFQMSILFDIVRRSKYLNDTMNAIKLNIVQLFYNLILLFMVIYVYSVFEFFSLRQYFNSVDYMGTESSEVTINAYCDKIYNCFLSILSVGLATRDGLGIIGGELSRNDKDYWKKYLLDVTFYFIVLVCLMTNIFSVILLSFRELRDQLKMKRKNIKENCIVCGIPKYVFEIKGNGWVSHYKYEHNIFAYLYYIIELEEKEINDCDGMEKHVKLCIANEDYTFLPLNQSMILAKKQEMKRVDESGEAVDYEPDMDGSNYDILKRE